MNVKFKMLSDKGVTPSYSKVGDAGLDLTATSVNIVQTPDYGYVEYGTDLAFEIPEGYVGLLFPRSSISKTGMWLANSVGVVDSNYRGEVKLRFKAIPNTTKYEVGERVGQLVILPVPHISLLAVTELSDSNRGSQGFGDSGK